MGPQIADAGVIQIAPKLCRVAKARPLDTIPPQGGLYTARMPTEATSKRKKKGMTYADAGVDIDAGDRLVDLIKPAVRRTHGQRVMGQHGAFAAMFRLDFNEAIFQRNYKDPVLVACTDGVGTKVKLAAELGVINTVGIDCVAMNVNDLIVQGAEPLFFLDYLGLHTQEPETTAQIVEGVARGCEIAGCALIGGECAEMPDIYAEGDFDIAGFSVGVVELHRAIDPLHAQAGDVLIGLPSSGVHSNGFSLVRKIISKRRLKLDREHAELDGESLGSLLLEPTRIYAQPIVKLLRHYRVKKVVSAMAHITGGGLPGNLPRMLPPKLDAVVDTRTWDIPPIFDFLQKMGGVETEEMYRVFNMGIGYVLAIRPSFADSVIRQLKKSGESARVIGHLTKGSGKVKMKGL
jgi:phosphoribosylformylglycinamidine cyclo-ligase